MLEWKKLSVDDKPYRKFEKQTFFSNLFLALRAHTFLELVTKNFYWDGFHAKKDLLVNDRVKSQFDWEGKSMLKQTSRIWFYPLELRQCLYGTSAPRLEKKLNSILFDDKHRKNFDIKL